jgi:inorganic phosphate transporter, PiT family
LIAGQDSRSLVPQGMAAESSSAAIILLSASFGYSLSTTHVATGSIIGTGLGKKGADVRWNVAGRMATAWLFTLPSAGVVGALSYWLAHGIGGSLGVIILLAILAGLSGPSTGGPVPPRSTTTT